ncbi:MAG: HAMP domain-containing protein [Kiritimatiellae bacterium]|nr:HAMP domain-containing protein [Kiritimatiellia bacterium]
MKSRKTTLVRALLAWLLVTLVCVGLAMGLTGYWVIKASVEASIGRRAQQMADSLADQLREHVWNLDDGSLRDHLGQHSSGAVPDLVHVRFLTEFEDPICEVDLGEEPDPIIRRSPVMREGRRIGFVETSYSRRGVMDTQRIIIRSTALVIGGGAVAIFLVTIWLMRMILQRPLVGLARELRSIAGGDYSRRLPAGEHREIDIINREVNAMGQQIEERTNQLKDEIRERKEAEKALQALRDRLEIQVTERTLALQRAYEDLAQETKERRQTQDEMLQIAHREQQRIGSDIHDALGQQLAGASFLLGSLEKRLRDRGIPETDLAAEVGEYLRDAVSKARHIAYGLAPTGLSEEGLIDALEALTENTETLFHMKCDFSHTPVCHITDGTVAVHLYRIVQEALHNAASHGKAGHVWISLALDGVDGVLTIRDNGSGLDRCEPSRHGMGLRIMHFRAETIGGELDMSINEAGGATVTVTFRDLPPEEKE